MKRRLIGINGVPSVLVLRPPYKGARERERGNTEGGHGEERRGGEGGGRQKGGEGLLCLILTIFLADLTLATQHSAWGTWPG